MKKAVLGILAHVDAGKTTLSEAMLYLSGGIRELGRVDKGNAFFDTQAIERQRGITIFSKQAQLQLGDFDITLLDTPGHADFSAEMERTLQVLDYAILVINGTDGVQAHTRTLWQLLKRYGLPVFIFVNKMDQPGTDKESLMEQLKAGLSGSCVDFSVGKSEAFYENIAVCGESALNSFLEKGCVPHDDMVRMILERKVYPCYFGSALRLNGVEDLMKGLSEYSVSANWPTEFGARIFKITRDNQGNRLTHMKITGGSLKVRMPIQALGEKVNQIRIYSGEKYDTVNEVNAGSICTVAGLNTSSAGMVLGAEAVSLQPSLEPVLTYHILWQGETDNNSMLLKLRQLEEEEPLLHIVWNEELQEIHAKLMGEIQQEVLADRVRERFGISIAFGEGNIVYKETIIDMVEGVGHFEPLRHYAEVHLILEPGEQGSGLVFKSDISEDELERSWQRLIMTHLEEKEHRGVLLGAPITDMEITLAGGRAHKKHTEGGDFRQATYRAVRHGLRQASSVLLEPWYEFRIEAPEENIGRVMTDIEKRAGFFQMPSSEMGISALKGKAPVFTMRSYQKELMAFTKGRGNLLMSFCGYAPCHNEAEIIEKSGYDPDRDLENTADSVFCSHGAGVTVNWRQVKEYMHVEERLVSGKDIKGAESGSSLRMRSVEPAWIGAEEIDKILNSASFANTGNKKTPFKKSNAGRERIYDAGSKPPKSLKLEQYLLVDGYNIIFAWKELKELAAVNIDGARGKLMDILSNYQSTSNFTLIIVFDAYKVENHKTEVFDYYNIHVVYTAYAETADQYIERFAYGNSSKYEITVATSDYLEQIITSGQGCRLLSARELEKTVRHASEKIIKEYALNQEKSKNYPMDNILKEIPENSNSKSLL